MPFPANASTIAADAMTTPIKAYLKQIEDNLRMGNATEHTHRPALKALLEALDPGVTATNEPKRIACGAPDFIRTSNRNTMHRLHMLNFLLTSVG